MKWKKLTKFKRNPDYTNYLTCKGVKYCSLLDETAFFEWIEKINCIASYEGALDELYLDLVDRDLKDTELKELIALFYRYKIDMKQLAQFKTEHNKDWFYDNKRAFWNKKVFGENKSHKK